MSHKANGMRVEIPDYHPHASGTGSITVVALDEDDKRRAWERERNKQPLGFVPLEEVTDEQPAA